MFERLKTPEDIFDFRLGSLLKMEEKLVDVLGDLQEHANRPDIKQALAAHREETRGHVANIERCFELLGQEPDDSPNPVVQAMAKEGKSVLKKTDDSLADPVVLAAAIESEHGEIALYESLIPHAYARGAADVALLLEENLEEEKHALDVARRTMQEIATTGAAV